MVFFYFTMGTAGIQGQSSPEVTLPGSRLLDSLVPLILVSHKTA